MKNDCKYIKSTHDIVIIHVNLIIHPRTDVFNMPIVFLINN